MLGIGKLGAGAEDYYLSAVAAGREDYYLREGEAPGRWVGQGARSLGLAGEVEAPELSRRPGRPRPGDGDQLVRGPGEARSRTPGFDLTFSAPKSVSLLFALGDPRQLAPRRWRSHERAVEAALAYLEDHAAFLRRGAGGAERVPALGLVGAAFVHRTSRAGDPALHTHVLVANMAEDHEGRFGALDSRAIYRARKDRRLPLPGRAAPSAGRAPRGRVGAGRATAPPRSTASRGEVIEAFSRRRPGDRAAHGRARRDERPRRRGGRPRHPRRQGLRRVGRAPRGRVARPGAPSSASGSARSRPACTAPGSASRSSWRSSASSTSSQARRG